MNIENTAAIQRGVEITVPLGKLEKSPRNARKTPHAVADIEALAASIAVKGVLQLPVVETERNGEGDATGGYAVAKGREKPWVPSSAVTPMTYRSLRRFFQIG